MNKVLLVGRFVKNPEIFLTNSEIKYTRFTIAVTTQFSADKVDFIPVIAWRQTADFIEKYVVKGSRVSVEGRFSSTQFKNPQDQTITRYEVAADRVQLLDTKSETERRLSNIQKNINSKDQLEKTIKRSMITKNKVSKQTPTETQDSPSYVPWDLDL